jgi:hypothetical protein
MNKLVTCPICDGSGYIEPTTQERMAQKREIARTLKSVGKPLREIAELLGYKSVSSVAELLKD